MTKKRLQNIALYYLKRFDSSTSNLRQVLMRRLADYAQKITDFNKEEAYLWVDEIIAYCQELGYINDKRYAEFKIDNYLLAGKPKPYIKLKMRQKGIAENIVDEILQNKDFDEEKAAIKFAVRKRIGPWRKNKEERLAFRAKDVAALVRAGFSYDTAQSVIDMEENNE